MRDMLHRAATVEDTTGRVLEGVAYRYDLPSRVTDDGWNTSYFEEITRGADRKTLTEHDEWPLRRLHDKNSDPYGTVTFHPSDNESALLFRAVVSDDDHGRSLMGDVHDGWTDVSVGGQALQTGRRWSDHHGWITQRRELRLLELSVAPAGVGLNSGAEVLVTRAASTPRLDALRRRRTLLLPR